ncbi:MAG: restriction endonuclease [Selenomonadaceae bacterium]|nr:restriction endonuclease [Selenomonadaceae bacterium]
MNLQLDESLATEYNSASQKIRVMSEGWLLSNAFCPCCGNDHINKIRNNVPVADMRCEICGEIFELKSKRNAVGQKITDGAYRTMIERITSNINPQLFVMQYSAALTVTNLTFIPKFFFTPDIIEKRKPLSANAKRAGWVGCNILYQKIPEQGKLRIIRDGKEVDASKVLRRYEQIKKLQTDNIGLRGWMLDVLNCINDIGSENFTLQQVYQYAEALKLKHNLNRNVEAKIRQQLQFLRDRGFVEFVGRGVYKKVIAYNE